MSGDLAAFLAARLDEDEAAAKSCPHQDWRAMGPSGGTWMLEGHAGSDGAWERWGHLAEGVRIHDPDHRCLLHAARHDPARVLREVAAGRRLIGRYCAAEAARKRDSEPGDELYSPTAAALYGQMLDEVAVHSGHPDYRQEWAPTASMRA